MHSDNRSKDKLLTYQLLQRRAVLHWPEAPRAPFHTYPSLESYDERAQGYRQMSQNHRREKAQRVRTDSFLSEHDSSNLGVPKRPSQKLPL